MNFTIIQEVLYQQNKELLQRIADDKYLHEDQKQEFIHKYHKKNFSYVQSIQRDVIPSYEKKISRLRLNE